MQAERGEPLWLLSTLLINFYAYCAEYSYCACAEYSCCRYFPDATQDPVIQIASMITCQVNTMHHQPPAGSHNYGHDHMPPAHSSPVCMQGDTKPVVRNVMTLNTCAPIAGSHVQSFDSEKELLLAWRSLVQHTDPDVVIGYNTQNFDLPYLLDRAEALKVLPAVCYIVAVHCGCLIHSSTLAAVSTSWRVHSGRLIHSLCWSLKLQRCHPSDSLQALELWQCCCLGCGSAAAWAVAVLLLEL